MKKGEKISCYIETRKNGYKCVSVNKTEEQAEFEIIGIQPQFPGSEHKLLMILLPDDYWGWSVGTFNTLFQGVNVKFLGKKFYEITEQFIIKEEIVEVKNDNT